MIQFLEEGLMNNYGSPCPPLNKKIKQGNCDFLSHNSDFFPQNSEI